MYNSPSLSLFWFLMQILNPNPDAMSKMITEYASEEFLYSLSNYCALQVGDMYTQVWWIFAFIFLYDDLKIVV